ncbi:hypothetical protein ACFY4K_03490 [Streptomyces leeuwenhoekii]|uniref:hypothetical protein n=1 Tax=Streptomyces TaxID=1883 RepID=UPI000A85B6AB|nr:hypothetical protein [Streptomyces cyaneogriseus]
MSACSPRIHGSCASIGGELTVCCWRAMAGSLDEAPGGAGRLRAGSVSRTLPVGNNYW